MGAEFPLCLSQLEAVALGNVRAKHTGLVNKCARAIPWLHIGNGSQLDIFIIYFGACRADLSKVHFSGLKLTSSSNKPA